jgi:hypothetical protein
VVSEFGNDWQLVTSSTEVLCGEIKPHELSQRKVMKQYQIEFSHRFAALGNLNDSEDMGRAWENIKDGIKISAEDT